MKENKAKAPNALDNKPAAFKSLCICQRDRGTSRTNTQCVALKCIIYIGLCYARK